MLVIQRLTLQVDMMHFMENEDYFEIMALFQEVQFKRNDLALISSWINLIVKF